MEKHKHGQTESVPKLAFSTTSHCLLGCGLGEVLGVIIGVALGLAVWQSLTIGVTLGFVFGFLLGILPLIKMDKEEMRREMEKLVLLSVIKEKRLIKDRLLKEKFG